MTTKYILAIETSCDDTSIAISKNDQILINVNRSSLQAHKQYGGIVPEIASRSHLVNLPKCLSNSMQKAKLKFNQLTHIAYTSTPGLPGSLHTGKVFAKSMASLLNIPLLPVDHMLGHIYSYAINQTKIISYPFIALVVSGGHTCIYLVKSINNIEILNQTTDDAVGEVLDKVGRFLKLDYPGGISIDCIYNPTKINIKMIRHFKPTDNFSFSGIKTNILNLINKSKMQKHKIDHVAIASSLLHWIVEEIIIKLKFYLTKYPITKFIAIGGGVSANSVLRQEIKNIGKLVYLPELKYANDNAAMIANFAYLLSK
ncbi:MAG: tRNA (adenosine(37)-N6)-threonylcarbamoyltransferase complex transferase subunit TsaD [Mycoplasmataceae bacterium]|jgi:N6-L-threonylcarbamoyladenine synthase|nr:tRNA (adenosine(37)-N6)-threonylcarbamoyltransferase complex transferase subunit TsaD [Mycoplasmataceae bacterium]